MPCVIEIERYKFPSRNYVDKRRLLCHDFVDIVAALLRESGVWPGLGKDKDMKTKKWIALALTLLMLLSLAPAALAAESVLGDVLADLGPGLSLRSMIDPNKGQIDLAGSSFQLENLVFFDDAVVGEQSNICLTETTENAMILDENALPEGLKYEVRREKVRVPDGRDGVWVADEIRRERAGQPAPDEPELDEADKDRETYYLYLTGKPKQAGEYLFVLWDGTIKLCSVTVLTERPEPTAAPAQPEQPTQSEQPAQQEPIVEETWVDFNQQDTTPTNPPAPAFILPDPSVSITGAATVQQGESVRLEAVVTDAYNPSYQWFVWDGQAWQTLSGETGSSYQPDTSSAGTWAYLCQVTNSYNGQTSNPSSEYVTVTVEAAPSVPVPNVGNITGSTKVEQGQNAVLEVHATDTYNASYQWYENNTPISGANASQYRPDTSSAGTQTYVCEVTNTYNGQSATAYSNPVTFTVEAKPTLPTPTVSIKGNTSVRTGERAVLEAEVSNAFNVSFQWYVGYGNYWAKIDDETGRSIRYSPDTNRAGTWTYYCEITSSGYGDSITVNSDPVTFTVADRVVVTPTPTPTPRVSRIEVAKLPNKIDYNDGEAVDATGLQIRVYYVDNSSKVIDSGFVVSTQTVSYNNTGLADVNVYYRANQNTYQTSYQVKVHSIAEMIRGIGVLTMPNKSSYTVGEYLNTAGLTIRVYSTDGRYLDVGEGFTCSPTYFSNPGNQTVTVSFMGKTCTFTVAVQQARRVTGLSIQSLPANRSYTVGDTISTAGLVLQLQTTGGYETVTSGYTISPRVATTAGSQQITVNYEGMSTTYTIDVRSNIPYATPTPTPYYGATTPSGAMPTPLPIGTTPAPYGVSPSPAPFGTVSPSPTGFPVPSASVAPTPVHTPAPARRNTGVSTAVKVLFVVAVVALGGLIGYVLYLHKTGGDEEDFVDEPRTSEKIRNIFKKK